MPNSLQDQEGVLREKLNSLQQSACGYVATMTKVCVQINELLADFSNLVQVQNLQATLSDAFRNYGDNISRTKGLLSDSSVELHEIQGFYEAQEVKKRLYDDRIEQVSEELPRVNTSSPRGSVKLQSSRTCKLSAESLRLHEAKIAAEKAALLEKQTEQKRARTIAMKFKLLELEMKQKQFEFQHQLELAKLDAEKEAEEARERTEVADLECKLAEREFSCLLLEENRPERHSVNRDIDGNFTSTTDAGPPVVLPQAVSTQLGSTAQDCTHPVLSTRSAIYPTWCTSFHASPPTWSASSTQVSTCHVTSSRVSVLPDKSSRGSMLPVSSSRVPEFSTTPFRVPVVSSRVSTLPTYSTRAPDFPPVPTCASLRASAVPVVSSRVSTLPTYPRVFLIFHPCLRVLPCEPLQFQWCPRASPRYLRILRVFLIFHPCLRVLLWFLLCPCLPQRCHPRMFPSFHARARLFLPCTRVSPCFLRFLPSCPTMLVRYLHKQL